MILRNLLRVLEHLKSTFRNPFFLRVPNTGQKGSNSHLFSKSVMYVSVGITNAKCQIGMYFQVQYSTTKCVSVLTN